jgi:hypothetical protein
MINKVQRLKQHSSIPKMNLIHYMRAMKDMEDMEDMDDMEAKPKDSPLDYTILRIVVITLSLVLLLQLLRHKLDAYTLRMPLFKTVLEGVYEECKSSITCQKKNLSDLVYLHIRFSKITFH